LKIAFVIPAQPEDTHWLPPLAVAYVAAILEQQRHIVRIYDLSLRGEITLAEALAPLRTFRPQAIAVVSGDPRARAEVRSALQPCEAQIVDVQSDAHGLLSGFSSARRLWQIDEQYHGLNEQNVIFNSLVLLDNQLDGLPFPARHLLALEQYQLATPAGDLQTTMLVGQWSSSGQVLFRTPKQIVAELRSVAREHGIRHIVFLDPLLTYDLAWLQELLYDLEAADLGIGWEGRVCYSSLTPELLQQFQSAGCEILGLEFQAAEVLDSRGKRTTLTTVVNQAHELGMAVRAHIMLAPPYDAIPALVDLSATFGLDDVRFTVDQRTAHQEPIAYMAEMAHTRYLSRRSRQFFIERYGPQLGPMLWRVGRAGLLGPTWQRYADGGLADPVSI
jgi:hypothetical protein